ncbi:hypothetical protein BRADI_2g47177v3 [Brachypodium distachyon]|uniref:Uncharacterized protein n=1 Tax=Brachypodium distachyon TaxID=15368 RepID=A0A2K2DEC9_BRADI|nr:hypothetical protein BRADI_2g47177v3 [Brachypodium distachyon]PNT72627.1 hypothetical protein BRADI_2g47177v3 [Brachypodium distachyon]PNT72628.1 hypothetical protein BRADI_2g47177v3 [Brachypodium distachyon]PNT72629.1 hypothetical protein BRADI_2g47177v3 [Brachypodium distachyon]
MGPLFCLRDGLARILVWVRQGILELWRRWWRCCMWRWRVWPRHRGRAPTWTTSCRCSGACPSTWRRRRRTSPCCCPPASPRRTMVSATESSADGLKYCDLMEGRGPAAEKGSTVEHHRCVEP